MPWATRIRSTINRKTARTMTNEELEIKARKLEEALTALRQSVVFMAEELVKIGNQTNTGDMGKIRRALQMAKSAGV